MHIQSMILSSVFNLENRQFSCNLHENGESFCRSSFTDKVISTIKLEERLRDFQVNEESQKGPKIMIKY